MFDDLVKEKKKEKNTGIKVHDIKDAKIAAQEKYCPKCKSLNVISTGYMNFPPYHNMKTMKCLNCNHAWHVLPIM